MLSRVPRIISISSILFLILQFCAISIHATAAEDTKTKVDRISGYLDRSNRMIDAFNATAESLDGIWADIEDAIDANDFTALPNLTSRTADARKNMNAHNASFGVLLSAEDTECSNLIGGGSSIEAVYDICAEFEDSNNAAADSKMVAEEVLSVVESKLTKLSRAAADADAKAAAQKKATPVATPKATPVATPKATPVATPKVTPVATPKVTPTPKITTKKPVPVVAKSPTVMCKKPGQTSRPAIGGKCIPGWTK